MGLSTTRLMQELPNQEQLSEYEGTTRTQSPNKTGSLQSCSHDPLSCMPAKHGKSTVGEQGSKTDSILIYACETWTVYCRRARKQNRFHINCLLRLLCINWQDLIPDTEILKLAGRQSFHAIVITPQLRNAGHVIRMTD